jgi:hypothetical protein
MPEERQHKRQWRAYKTESGSSPVKEFLAALDSDDAQMVALAMKEVAVYGLVSAGTCGATSTKCEQMATIKPFVFFLLLKAGIIKYY